MNQLAARTELTLDWIDQSLQEEFIRASLSSYFICALTAELPYVHEILMDNSYLLITGASLHETNGEDENRYWNELQDIDEDYYIQEYHDIIDLYYEEGYNDLLKILNYFKLSYTEKILGEDDDDRYLIQYYSMEVW